MKISELKSLSLPSSLTVLSLFFRKPQTFQPRKVYKQSRLLHPPSLDSLCFLLVITLLEHSDIMWAA